MGATMTWTIVSTALFYFLVFHSTLCFPVALANATPSEMPYHQALQAWSFLESYGYLPKSNENNSFNLLSAHERQKAIKLMQRYAALPQTGQLDEKTLAKMKAPRCGLPDVTDSDKRAYRLKRFASYGTKWTKMPITWSLTNPSGVVPPEKARATFDKAFNIWATASPKLRFQYVDSEEANIKIGFYIREHGCGTRQAFDGRGTKLAHAFSPPKGDVHFDDEEDWTEGESLFWTALHEFGHSLGFAHTADESSIMFPYYQEHGGNFKLPEVDKAGIRYLYDSLEHPSTDTPAFTEKWPQSVSPTPRAIDDGRKDYPCNTNVDAIASIRGEIFIFKQNVFWWLQSGLTLVRNESIPIAQYFSGFPDNINKVDAVYERRSDQKIMFFVGKQYWLFSANMLHSGPYQLADLGLPENLDSIDAIINWGNNGRAYIFSGTIYWKLDDQENQVERDYPRDMSVWKGVPFHLDAAFTWQYDSATYFFKDNKFWMFNNHDMKVEATYPKLIQDFWFRSLKCDRPSDLTARSNSSVNFGSIQFLTWICAMMNFVLSAIVVKSGTL